MAFFNNTNISFESKNGDTVIGTEAYFQGTLTAKGSLRVDGRVDGSIVDAKMVTIGKSGKVKGDVSCEVCYISGEIRGTVTAIDHIEAQAGARIDGDLRAPRVIIEEGAIFNGNCSMELSRKPGQREAQVKNQKTEAIQQ